MGDTGNSIYDQMAEQRANPTQKPASPKPSVSPEQPVISPMLDQRVSNELGVPATVHGAPDTPLPPVKINQSNGTTIYDQMQESQTPPNQPHQPTADDKIEEFKKHQDETSTKGLLHKLWNLPSKAEDAALDVMPSWMGPESSWGKTAVGEKEWEQKFIEAMTDAGAEPAKALEAFKQLKERGLVGMPILQNALPVSGGAYIPPYASVPQNLSDKEFEEETAKDFPHLYGAGRGVGNLVGGLLTPTNLALLVAMPEAKAAPILSKLLATTFAAQMNADNFATINELSKNWYKYTPAERSEKLTEALGGTALAIGAATHMGKTFAGEQKPGTKMQAPATPKGQPVDRRTTLRPTTVTRAGVTVPIPAMMQENAPKISKLATKGMKPGQAREFQENITKPAATDQAMSILGGAAEDKIAAHEALVNNTPYVPRDENTPSKFTKPEEMWQAMQQSAEQTPNKARAISNAEAAEWQKEHDEAEAKHRELLEAHNKNVDEWNSDPANKNAEPLEHVAYNEDDLNFREKPKTYDELKADIDAARTRIKRGSADEVTKAIQTDLPKAQKAMDQWFKDHEDQVSPAEYQSFKNLWADSKNFQLMDRKLSDAINQGTLTGRQIRGLEAAVDNAAKTRSGAAGIGTFRRLVGDRVYDNLQSVSKLFDPIEKNDPFSQIVSWGTFAARHMFSSIIEPILGHYAAAGVTEAANIGYDWFMHNILFNPEFGSSFGKMVTATRDAIKTGVKVPANIVDGFRSMVVRAIEAYRQSKLSREEGAVGASITPRRTGQIKKGGSAFDQMAEEREQSPDFNIVRSRVLSRNGHPTHLEVTIDPGPRFRTWDHDTDFGDKLFPEYAGRMFSRGTEMENGGMAGNTKLPQGRYRSLRNYHIQFDNPKELQEAYNKLQGIASGKPALPEKTTTREWPSDEKLISKYGEASDPAQTAFLLTDGRKVRMAPGSEHDRMLGGKPTDDLRTPYVNETGNIRMRAYGAYGDRQFGFSLPKDGITPEQLNEILKWGPQLRTGRVYLEHADAEGQHEVLQAPSNEELEAAIRKLVPIKGENTSTADQLAAHNANGGSTFSAEGKNLSGADKWAVGERPDLSETVQGPLTREKLDAYKKRVAHVLDENHAVGTWVDPSTGHTALDVARLVQDRDQAIEAGKRSNQKAIYHLGRGETVETGGTGEVPKNGAIPVYSKELRQALGTNTKKGEQAWKDNKNFRLTDENGKPINAFFSVSPEGLITGVINKSETHGLMPRILEIAKQHGGTEGMVWDGNDHLMKQYEDAGFVAGRHEDYDEERFGKPSQETKDYWSKRLGWKEGDPYPGVTFTELPPAEGDTSFDMGWNDTMPGAAPEEASTQAAVKGSTVGLMNNPLKVEASNEQNVRTMDVAQALNNHTTERLPALELGKAKPEEQVARAKEIMEDEARYQLAQDNSGTAWYTEQMDEHDQVAREMRPYLKNDTKLSLFKYAEAILSSGQKPYRNFVAAMEAMDHFQKNGVFARKNPKTKLSWGPRGEKAYGNAFDMLNSLIKRYGQKGAVKWLQDSHPVEELKKYNINVSGKKTDLRPGSIILGEKRGPFSQNLHKQETAFTADMWVARSWNRWMGTLETDFENPELKGELLSDSPRNDAERSLMKQSFSEVADKLGLTTSSLQAVLWYYEQALYSVHGTPKESWSFADAARRAQAEERELQGAGAGKAMKAAQHGVFDLDEAPEENAVPPTVRPAEPGKQMVGTAAGAAADTAYFQAAKAENPTGTTSQWLQRAQEMKDQLKNTPRQATPATFGSGEYAMPATVNLPALSPEIMKLKGAEKPMLERTPSGRISMTNQKLQDIADWANANVEPEQAIRSTAHEMAHAFLQHYLGVSTEGIQIGLGHKAIRKGKPMGPGLGASPVDGVSGGYLHPGGHWNDLRDAAQTPEEKKEVIRKYTTQLMAGQAMEELMGGKHSEAEAHAKGDITSVKAVLKNYGITGNLANVLISQGVREAKEILKQNFDTLKHMTQQGVNHYGGEPIDSATFHKYRNGGAYEKK